MQVLLRRSRPAGRTPVWVWATRVFFATNGASFAGLLTRYPEVKDRLELTDTEFGLLVACFPLGAALIGTLPGRVASRFGAVPVIVLGTALMTLSLPLVALVPAVWAAAALLCAAGALDATVDTAQNEQGLVVQRATHLPVFHSLHASWSLGAVLGGTLAVMAAQAGIPLWIHLSVAAVMWTLAAVLAGRAPHPTSAVPREKTNRSARRRSGTAAAVVAAAALMTVAGTMAEDLGNNWSAVFTRTVHDAPGVVAGVAYVAMVSCHFLGRVTGDAVQGRLGIFRTFVLHGALASLGIALIASSQNAVWAVAGFATLGFGASVLVPLGFALVGEGQDADTTQPVARLGWIMRVGFLVTSPAIGGLAGLMPLPLAVAILGCALVVIMTVACLLLAGHRRYGQPPAQVVQGSTASGK